MAARRERDLDLGTLGALLRAELAGGILGLRLFIACVTVAAVLLGTVWMLGASLSQALEGNGLRILGGDVAVSVPNAPLDAARVDRLGAIGRLSRAVELRTSAAAGAVRATVELKAVDDAYPLYGALEIEGQLPPEQALGEREGRPGAVVKWAEGLGANRCAGVQLPR
jgi:putative ABC transport system permease protein